MMIDFKLFSVIDTNITTTLGRKNKANSKKLYSKKLTHTAY